MGHFGLCLRFSCGEYRQQYRWTSTEIFMQNIHNKKEVKK
jgi:hypothetical protein